MKNIFLNFVAATTLLVASTSLFAIPITGGLDFSGDTEVTSGGGSISLVHFIDFHNNPAHNDHIKVSNQSGSFDGFASNKARFWDLDPSAVGTPNLWKYQGFIFKINNILLNTVDGMGYGKIFATGFISKTGFDTTAGIFAFSTQNLDNGTKTTTFSASSVPAPATIALLGLALIGFSVARRKN
ncbi:MAG: PEP-CTERM sorting domain-containing protein [Alteromonadales bacterium]|nr:PEP-CTERM sorting domain-containing protein [Alteromonadales bacterium]